MSFAVWLTGLPASGKSAIAREVLRLLHERGVDASVLESDVMRTQLTPFPRYDEDDRSFFYGALLEIGAGLVRKGRPVIFDATANRRHYRDSARLYIERFCEVYVDTPVEICQARDVKGLYRNAAVTALPGGGTPYEPPRAPEVVVPGALRAPRDSARMIVAHLCDQGWVT